MFAWLFKSLIESVVLEIQSFHQTMESMMSHMQKVIDEIKAEVTEVRTVNESAIVLLDKLFNVFEQHADDPAELRNAVADLRASREALAASVTKNTPSEEPPADA